MKNDATNFVTLSKDNVEFDSKGRVVINDPNVLDFINSSFALKGEAIVGYEAGINGGCVNFYCPDKLAEPVPVINMNVGKLSDLGSTSDEIKR